MNEVRNILLGIEIREDVTRLAVYDRTAEEPVLVPARIGTNRFDFPTALAADGNGGRFYAGYEAEAEAGKGGVVSLPSPLLLAMRGEGAVIGGKEYTPEELMRRFLEGIIGVLGLMDPVRGISGVCVTVGELTPLLVRCIRAALLTAGFRREAVFVQDEKESFYYFGYSQKPVVSSRNMGLLRFEGGEVSFLGMTEMRARKPAAVSVREIGRFRPEGRDSERDGEVAARVREWLTGELYSGIFVTGSEFVREQMRETVIELSRGSGHVFSGDHIFVRGACLTCLERLERHAFRNRIYLGEGILRKSVGLDVIDGSKQIWYPLIPAGIAWHEAFAECQILPQGRRDLMVTLLDYDGGGHRSAKTELTGLPERPDGATRLLITSDCPDAQHARITAKDLGFGELFPASGLSWTLEMELEADA